MFKFLTRLTQEKLWPSEDDLFTLKGCSRSFRTALYHRLTQLSYIQNKEHDRMAALRIRNQLMRDTFSETNKSDGEKDPTKVQKPSDSLPETLATDAV